MCINKASSCLAFELIKLHRDKNRVKLNDVINDASVGGGVLEFDIDKIVE